MQSSSSPYVVNIVPLANIVTNTSGLDATSALSNSVATIQQMVNFEKKAIYTNYLGAFTAGNTIQIGSPLNLCNVGITSNGVPLASSSSQTSNIQAVSITASTITVGGTCYAQAFVTLSDKGVKGGLRPLPTISFDTLANVGTYKYRYFDSVKDDIGIVAQELEEVYPECVSVAHNGQKYVNYSALTAVLLQAVKELEGRVRALESRETSKP